MLEHRLIEIQEDLECRKNNRDFSEFIKERLTKSLESYAHDLALSAKGLTTHNILYVMRCNSYDRY